MVNTPQVTGVYLRNVTILRLASRPKRNEVISLPVTSENTSYNGGMRYDSGVQVYVLANQNRYDDGPEPYI